MGRCTLGRWELASLKQPAFIGPSYTLASVSVDCQRTLNLFPELDELGTGKNQEIASLRHTPGLQKIYGTGAAKQCRALYKATNGRLFGVLGFDLWEMNAATGVPFAVRGTVPGVKDISITDNGISMVLVNESRGYTYNFASNAFAQITDPDFPNGATAVTFIDQYIIVNVPNTRQFQISALADPTDWSGLDVGDKEAHPDNILTLIADHEDLILFGSQSIEFFFNSGNPSFPFERRTGGTIEQGVKAVHSIKKLDNSLFWLGQDNNGDPMVVRLNQYTPQRISTFAVETALKTYGDLGNASAWVYRKDGHSFYCLNCPGANTTWCYDIVSQLWHERASSNGDGSIGRHRVAHHVYTGAKHIVGDYQTDSIYEMRDDVYTDDGRTILRLRTAPHFGGENQVEHRAFQLDMETGVGTATGQGSDPQVMFDYSKDGGHTWSQERTASAGKIGEFLRRVVFRRLGTSYDRVNRVRITDPIPITLISGFVDAVRVK